MELRILCFLSVPKLTSLNRKFLSKVLFIDSVQVLSKRKSFETATLFERENYHYVLTLSESNHLVHMLSKIGSISSPSLPIPPTIEDYMGTASVVVLAFSCKLKH